MWLCCIEGSSAWTPTWLSQPSQHSWPPRTCVGASCMLKICHQSRGPQTVVHVLLWYAMYFQTGCRKKKKALQKSTIKTCHTCFISGNDRQEPARSLLLYTVRSCCRWLRWGRTLNKGLGQHGRNFCWCHQCISPSKQSLGTCALGDWLAVFLGW